MKKITVVVLTLLVVFAATISANGSQEEKGTYGQGSGRGSGYGLRDGSGAGGGTSQGSGYGRNSGGSVYKENFVEEIAEVWNIVPGSGTLTETDTEGLLLMVEEEKLARDVYTSLYNEWNVPIFKNIADSEQQHMDAVKLLLDANDVAVPAETETEGKFADSKLQSYYNELTEQGTLSLEEALSVGAMVEDLDIADLQKLVTESDNKEVKVLYQNLMKGSRNHMRSFTAQLERYDIEYEAVYIEDEYFELILKYNREMAPIADPDYSL